jgi:hypothetical protein
VATRTPRLTPEVSPRHPQPLVFTSSVPRNDVRRFRFPFLAVRRAARNRTGFGARLWLGGNYRGRLVDRWSSGPAEVVVGKPSSRAPTAPSPGTPPLVRAPTVNPPPGIPRKTPPIFVTSIGEKERVSFVEDDLVKARVNVQDGHLGKMPGPDSWTPEKKNGPIFRPPDGPRETENGTAGHRSSGHLT